MNMHESHRLWCQECTKTVVFFSNASHPYTILGLLGSRVHAKSWARPGCHVCFNLHISARVLWALGVAVLQTTDYIGLQSPRTTENGAAPSMHRNGAAVSIDLAIDSVR